VADTLLSSLSSDLTIPFSTEGAARAIGLEPTVVQDGTYRVLASLVYGTRTYRVFGDLVARDGNAHLRCFRFELPSQDEWFAQRKISLPIATPEIVRLAHRISGAEFALCQPVHLDDAVASEFFGEAGPPVT
jgi:hypothetical protein